MAMHRCLRWLPLVLMASLVGCRSAAVRLGPAPSLTCKAEPQFRWRDALDNPYGEAFRKRFSYAKAKVTVRFPKAAPRFSGTLTARALKPNFAYQMKLVGMPLLVWKEKGDEEANRRLGDIGRWWRPGKDGGNAYFYTWETDEEKDKSQMEGYVLFAYFVTDTEGNATADFRLDRSLHVLWKTSQWPPAEEDAKPTRHRIVPGRYGYDREFEAGQVELYGEAERGRPAVGAAKLPPGRYRCFFLLTEETFHAWGAGDGGDWAPAMAAPIEFTITEAPAEKPKAPESTPAPAPPHP